MTLLKFISCVIRNHPHKSHKLRRHALLLQLLVNNLGDILRQDLHQGLGLEFPHAIILDLTSWQI